MPEAELTEREKLHILLACRTGAGKTTLCSTFPKPMFVALFDAVNNAQPYLERGIASNFKMDNQHKVYYREVFSKKDPEKLIIRIEYWGEANPARPTSYGRWIQRATNLEGEIIDKKYQTAILDSATGFELAARYYSENYLNSESKDGRQHYGFSRKACEQYIMMRWPNMLLCNSIVTAHVDDQKDEGESDQGGTVIRKMVALPGTLPNRLPSQFGEIWRIYIDQDGSRKLQTQPRAGNAYDCKSLLHFPDGTYPHYDALWAAKDAADKEASNG